MTTPTGVSLSDRTRRQITYLAHIWGLPPKRHLSLAVTMMAQIVFDQQTRGIRMEQDKRHESLPYPTALLSERPKIIEYLIPEDEKESILQQFYPFESVPGLDELRFDLHEGKHFTVKDFMIVRENKMNLLVSPYYMSSGGTVLDWQ